MTTSRIYMGVHSFTDVAAGIALGAGCFHVHAQAKLVLETAIASLSPLAPLAAAAAAVVAYMVITRPPRWTTAPGDTTLILGVWGGVMAGSALVPRYGSSLLLDVLGGGAGAVAVTAHPVAVRVLARCTVGYAVLFATRAVVKGVVMPAMTALAPASNEEPRHRYIIELPTKFATYAAVGFNAVCTVPMLHDWLAI
jgi:hypothetical protein